VHSAGPDWTRFSIRIDVWLVCPVLCDESVESFWNCEPEQGERAAGFSWPSDHNGCVGSEYCVGDAGVWDVSTIETGCWVWISHCSIQVVGRLPGY